MEKHGIPGTLKFFGEPAEKVCGSKPVHAAHGYYDDLDAAISFHPAYFRSYSNTTIWDTHCGAYWSKIYTFECPHPETWAAMGASDSANPHTSARAPGAIDAVCLMYTASKYTKEAMLPHTGTWTINEAILAAGQSTSDNLAPNFSQIQYASRAPTLAMQERIYAVLDNNADHAAGITHCTVRKGWVTKTRPGLPNHVMAGVCYANLELAGPPAWGEEARKFGREIQKNLGLKPAKDPLMREMGELIAPEAAEAAAAQGPAGLAEELHLRRLHRLHLALPDRAADDRPRHAGAAGARLSVPGLGVERARRLFADHRSHGVRGRPHHRPDLHRPDDQAGRAGGGQGRVQGAQRRRHRRQGLGAAPPRQELQGADPLPLAGIRDHAARAGVVDTGGGVRGGQDGSHRI